MLMEKADADAVHRCMASPYYFADVMHRYMGAAYYFASVAPVHSA